MSEPTGNRLWDIDDCPSQYARMIPGTPLAPKPWTMLSAGASSQSPATVQEAGHRPAGRLISSKTKFSPTAIARLFNRAIMADAAVLLAAWGMLAILFPASALPLGTSLTFVSLNGAYWVDAWNLQNNG